MTDSASRKKILIGGSMKERKPQYPPEFDHEDWKVQFCEETPILQLFGEIIESFDTILGPKTYGDNRAIYDNIWNQVNLMLDKAFELGYNKGVDDTCESIAMVKELKDG
jgi:hypothetical protein